MSAKLIQYWNIRAGCQGDFDAFFAQDFVAGINATGLMRIVESWHTASGEGPYFLVEGVSPSLEEAESMIMGTVFSELRQKLFHLVSEYTTKLLIPRNGPGSEAGESLSGGVEMEKEYKFTQHFNINAADVYAFDSFFKKTYARQIIKWGIHLVEEWNVAIGATPYVVIETRAEALGSIGKMLQSQEYRELTTKLLNMVSGYGCKILMPSGHLNK